jgi:hypothetical protein
MTRIISLHRRPSRHLKPATTVAYELWRLAGLLAIVAIATCVAAALR